jgi:cell division protein FtsL
MRIILGIIMVLIYLFSLVYIESELVKSRIRKEGLLNQIQELKNEQNNLKSQITSLSSLARIEAEAKKRGFVFPQKDDILGVVK